MMASAYAIKDWDELFRTSELERKVKVWRYVPLPIKLAGERFRTLMATKFGRQNFALFVALCECGANLPTRGLLADERGALTPRGISIRTGIPEAAVKQGLTALSHPDIGWLVSVEIGEPSGQHPETIRTNPSLAFLAKPSQAHAAAAANGAVRKIADEPPGFSKFWKRYPAGRRADKSGCLKKWRTRNLEASAAVILRGLDAHLICRQWNDAARGESLIPLVTTFLNQSRWEAVPERADGVETIRRVTHEEVQKILGSEG